MYVIECIKKKVHKKFQDQRTNFKTVRVNCIKQSQDNVLLRTIPGISELLQRLDHVISTEFIPSITGGITPSHVERKLMSLPTKLGGLGIPIFQRYQKANTATLAC